MTERAAIGARLRVARESAGFTQAHVASAMELHRPTIVEIEAGRRRIYAEELAAFCALYGISADWALGREQGSVNPAVSLAALKLARLGPESLGSVIELLEALQRLQHVETP